MASERTVIGIGCCHRTIGTEPAHAVVDRCARAAQRHGDISALLIPALPDLTDFGAADRPLSYMLGRAASGDYSAFGDAS